MSGGHLFALQSVAWLRMAIDFSRNDTLQNALVKTFSGEHPCPLCIKVQTSWQEKQKQDKDAPTITPEIFSEAVCDGQLLTVPEAPTQLAQRGAFGSEFFYHLSGSPPKPPPRA